MVSKSGIVTQDEQNDEYKSPHIKHVPQQVLTSLPSSGFVKKSSRASEGCPAQLRLARIGSEWSVVTQDDKSSEH